MPKICVKWSGKKFEVDANTELEPLVFKSQLFELTGVLPDRQKVLIKGQQLKDTWEGINLHDGLTIMMMGSAAEDVTSTVDSENSAVAAVAQTQKNADALAALERNSKEQMQLILPVGLRNLGNTCYMNACFQAYKTIPELMVALRNYSAAENEANRRSHLLILSAKKLYDELSRMERANTANRGGEGENGEPRSHTPLFLLMTMHSAFPQFAARDGHGQYQQQDANECFSQVLQIIANQTDVPVGQGFAGIFDGTSSDGNTALHAAKINAARLFETEFDVTLKCMESEEEPMQKSRESQMQLSCFLTQEVRYIQSGIKNRLTEEIEKNSSTLNRNVKYEKRSLIARLPEYLCVQMVRFFYKQKEQISAKILKDVKFPINLDMYDVCTPELQEKLQPMRDRYKNYDDQKVEELRRSKMDERMEKTATTTDGKNEEFWSNSFQDDPGSNCSGFYELKAVITHKGRSSNSGHYVAWVRLPGNNGKWAMCDDDVVRPTTEEEVLKLSGGGDWHCGYVFIYGPRPLPKNDNKSMEVAAELAIQEATKMELD